MALVYFNRDFIDEPLAQIPITTHALHYGTAVFEGLRSYGDGARACLFRPREHYERFLATADLLAMKPDHTVDELIALTIELLRCNGYLDDRYIRPILFKNAQKVGAGLPEGETLAILAMPMPHGSTPRQPASATWSRWRRFPASTCPAGAKITGLYVNSSLARADALARGFDQAILLTTEGFVAEGSGANLFAVHGQRIVTPPPEADILPGITRDTLLEYFRSQRNFEISEAPLRPEEVASANEVFLCGTGMEVYPIGRIEDQVIGYGGIGAITADVMQWYADLVRGRNTCNPDWLVPVSPD